MLAASDAAAWAGVAVVGIMFLGGLVAAVVRLKLAQVRERERARRKGRRPPLTGK